MSPEFLDRILPLNLFLSLVIVFITAKIYVYPRLKDISAKTLFIPILLFHAERHLGLMFLAPGALKSELPTVFSLPAALGDTAAAVLAVIALYTVVKDKPYSNKAMWAFNLFGFVDLVIAVSIGAIANVGPMVGATHWIPAFLVPILLVSHIVVFKKLMMNKATV